MPDHFYTVAQAADVLGLSAPTIRRMVRDGELQTFQTPGGHLRVAAESVERIRQGRTKETRNREPSSVLKNRREAVEEIGLQALELRGQRDLRKLRKEEAEERDRDREGLARQERARREEEQKPRREAERALLQEDRCRREREESAQFERDVAQDQQSRDAIIEAAISEAERTLPFGARNFGSPSKWQLQFRRTARSDIAKLGMVATPEAIQDAACEAAQAVGEEYEQSEVRKAEQEERASKLREESRAREAEEKERASKLREESRAREAEQREEEANVQIGLGHVDHYFVGLKSKGEFEFDYSEMWKLAKRAKRVIRSELLEELQADPGLDREEIEGIVEELVDGFLNEEFED